MTHFQQTVTRVGLELDVVGAMIVGGVARGVVNKGGVHTRGGGVTRRYLSMRESKGGALLMGD